MWWQTNPSTWFIFFVVVVFSSMWVSTQGLLFERQVLNHLSYTSSQSQNLEGRGRRIATGLHSDTLFPAKQNKAKQNKTSSHQKKKN
jgi:hypothetical protein